MYEITKEFMPFYMTYGLKAIIPIKLEIPSLQLTLQHGLRDEQLMNKQLMIIEELNKN